MTRLLYLDCFSGISGDMLLGALLDAGLPLEALKRALGGLAAGDIEIDARRVLRAGISATKFTVREPRPSSVPAHASAAHVHASSHSHEHDSVSHHPHRHDQASANLPDRSHTPHGSHEDEHTARSHVHRSLPEIVAAIDRSALSTSGRDRARALFHRLAEAEAAIHQMPIERVHLHEVGALDSIVDIVGAVFGLEWFGADRIVSSPLNVGGGMVSSAHGVFPVPAPATLMLLGDAPVYAGTIQSELVTPTGALLVTAYASSFGPIPPMSIERVGYGAGDREFGTTPNVLRVLVGRSAEQSPAERVSVIECEIDDMNPQLFSVAMDRLYAAGALEVFYVPVQMKKNRPGTLLTVIAPPERQPALADIIFRETTTIGLRHSQMDRECLERELVTVETPIGAVRMKVARRAGRVVNAVPEFEDCAKLASASNVSVKTVQALAVKAYDGYEGPES